MRPLGLTDTIFYHLGDCYITGVAVLDGPCNLALLLAEFEGVLAELPALAERPVRVGLWSFAQFVGPLDLSEHVAIFRDPSVTTLEEAIPRLERLRRNPIGRDGPPWRIFVLNPEEPGKPATGPAPLSAIYLQVRHGLADAMRGLQILGRMSGYEEATPAHEALALRLPVVDPGDLPDRIPVHDVGISILQVERRVMSREGEASERMTAVAATAVADESLFPHARPLRGNVGRTRFVRRRGPRNGVGNHMKMVTVRTGTAETRRRFRIPGLSRAQDLPLSQWLIALAPRALGRRLMRLWYSSFDAVATLVPLPRHMRLGGRAVTSVFGVPPLWGPVPLVLVALADGEHYHVTVIPGQGFTKDRQVLLDRLRGLFGPEEAASAIEAPAPAGAGVAKTREPRGSPAFAKGR